MKIETKFCIGLLIMAVVITVVCTLLLRNFDKENNINEVIERVSVSTVRANLIDSINTIHAKRERFIKDSLNRRHEKEMRFAETKAKFYQTKFEKEAFDYKADTTSRSGKVDEMLYDAEETIYYKDRQIAEQDSINQNLKQIITIQDTLIDSKTKTIVNLNNGNEMLMKSLKAQKPTWWDNNGNVVFGGVGFGFGAVLTYFVMK